MIREKHFRAAMARGDLGGRHQPGRPRSSSACSAKHGRAWRSAALPRHAAPMRRPTSSRSWCGGGFGNNNVDTCARVCHSPTGYGLRTRLSAPRPARRTSIRSSRPTSSVDHRRQPDRPPIRCSPRGMKKRLRQGAKLIVHRSASHRPGASTPHVEAQYHLPLQSRHQCRDAECRSRTSSSPKAW